MRSIITQAVRICKHSFHFLGCLFVDKLLIAKTEDPTACQSLDLPRCRVLLYILFGLNCHAHPLGIGLVLFCSYDLKVFWRTDYLLLFSFGMYYSSRLLNLS